MTDPRIEVIFQATVGLPPEARRAEVARLCAGDVELEARCLRLLEAADEATRAGALDGGVAAILESDPMESTPIDTSSARVKARLSHPAAIGPYRILSVLGQGGFGVVYGAERREPIRQRVAIKVIKPGMDSRAVIARFEQERQALAVMNHPNIAKILDAGVTDGALGSRPYFVMEHVQGEPITEYCDRHNLTLRQRLELFIPVCEAVQHAHHKGIIHRDLKPSNILVTVIDCKVVPIVIDFGVAKATAKTFTDATIFTEAGQFIGTPEYMSPEQAEMGATDIDTRSDVYSLGAILYELLAGAVPFDSKSLRAAALFEIQRIIREVDPPKPSTRLSTLGADDAAAIAKRRQMDRDALAAELRRELDWIPLKALRKDRTERYATPNDLAHEIQNYLEGKPLDAGPESAGYRLRKFIRRHRGPVIAGSLVAVALALGIVGLSLGARWAMQEAQRAERQAELATQEAANARQAEVQARAAEAEQQRLAQANAALADAEAAQRSLAERERDRADHQARVALERAADAEAARDSADRSSYAANILAASATIQSGQMDMARGRLSLCRPDLRGWEWGHLWSLSDQAETSLRGHGYSVISAAFSPDGTRIVTASDDRTARVWNADGAGEPVVLRGHEGRVWPAAFSPDGTRIVTASDDRTARVWNADGAGKPVVLHGHEDTVYSAAFSPDGTRIVTASDDRTARVWNADGAGEPVVLRGHEGRVLSAAFSPDGTRIVTASWDNTARVWNAGGAGEPVVLHGHEGTVYSAAFSPDGTRIVTASDDRTARVWNADGAGEPVVLRGHEGWVWSAAFSPDGTRIVTASWDNTARVWNADGAGEPVVLRGHEGRVWSAAFSPDGTRIVTASDDDTARIWDSVPASYRYRQQLLAEGRLTRADLEQAVADGRLHQWEIEPLPWVLPTGEAAAWGGATSPSVVPPDLTAP